MLKLFTNLLLLLSSYASLIGLYLIVEPIDATRTPLHWSLLTLFAVSALFFIFFEIKSHFENAPKIYKTHEEINAYMCRWVSSAGRAVIFSRDMSWAQSRNVIDILIAKAARGELTVFIEKPTPLTEQLSQSGAKVVPYGRLGHIPKSRFTIVNFEREGAQVAAGVAENGKHVIQEFSSGGHPFFAVAEDLVKFLMASEGK